MAVFTALYDANVLYSVGITDISIRLARTDLFRLRWSNHIQEEWMRNLLDKRPDIDRTSLEQRRQNMDRAVPQALVTGYEELAKGLELPDAGDRHVLAAAIVGRADVIVTFNQKDFPVRYLAQFGLECQHPDEFLNHQRNLDETRFIEVIREARSDLTNPELNPDEYIERLRANQLPIIAGEIEKVKGLI